MSKRTKSSNAIYSEIIFDRTVWLQKSKEREMRNEIKSVRA